MNHNGVIHKTIQTPLNLFILDRNDLLGIPLSRYLKRRFSSRLIVSVFCDTNTCMKNMVIGTHVIVLDYLANDCISHIRTVTFQAIKDLNPKNEVIMIRSEHGIRLAANEIEYRTTKYILKREKELYDERQTHSLFIIKPLKKIITYPVKIFVEEFLVGQYLKMFLITFCLVALVVFLFYLI